MSSTHETNPKSRSPQPSTSVAALESIREALSNLRFGTVTVVVQDGVVVQVERLEKFRLTRS
jgi:hypothetical protein